MTKIKSELNSFMKTIEKCQYNHFPYEIYASNSKQNIHCSKQQDTKGKLENQIIQNKIKRIKVGTHKRK